MTGAALEPPRGLLRLLFKVPVWVARLGLGGWERILGLEWMLLITSGRKSGKTRYAMVDVLVYDRDEDTYYIEAGYGKKSDWYRNIQATPVFEAQVRRRRFRATVEQLSPDEAGDMMVSFVRRKPGYAKTVMKMAGMSFESEDALRRIASQMILLAVHPEA